MSSERCAARIFAVGTELLGDKRDANGPEAARALRSRGVAIAAIEQLPDDRALLGKEIARALETPGLLVLLGGLGPTADDVTREALCDATGLGVVEDAGGRARVEDLHARRGKPLVPSSLRQALVPEGAEVVANPTGFALGAVVVARGSVIVLLPGPPGELACMLDDALDRAVRRLREMGFAPAPPGDVADIVLAGLGEGEAEQRVLAVPEVRGLEIAWLARPGEVRCVVRGDAPQVSAAKAAVRAALGRDVVSVDGRGVAEVVLGTLREREETVALAESCTGGLVAAELTSVPGSSAAFRRGFVTYADDAKSEVLGVAERLLEEHGAVSREVALAMASGARRAGRADWGLAVTGIAGPDGGTDAKPVGLVHWALARPDGRLDAWHVVFPGSRDDVRRRSVSAALDSLRRAL